MVLKKIKKILQIKITIIDFYRNFLLKYKQNLVETSRLTKLEIIKLQNDLAILVTLAASKVRPSITWYEVLLSIVSDIHISYNFIKLRYKLHRATKRQQIVTQCLEEVTNLTLSAILVSAVLEKNSVYVFNTVGPVFILSEWLEPERVDLKPKLFFLPRRICFFVIYCCWSLIFFIYQLSYLVLRFLFIFRIYTFKFEEILDCIPQPPLLNFSHIYYCFIYFYYAIPFMIISSKFAIIAIVDSFIFFLIGILFAIYRAYKICDPQIKSLKLSLKLTSREDNFVTNHHDQLYLLFINFLVLHPLVMAVFFPEFV